MLNTNLPDESCRAAAEKAKSQTRAIDARLRARAGVMGAHGHISHCQDLRNNFEAQRVQFSEQ